MPSKMRIERSRRNFADETNRYDAKREALVRCARKLGEEGNAAKVSVTDITQAMGITRGLFYYYFSGKEELNCAIADSYVDDMIKDVRAALDAPMEDRVDTVRAIVACVRNLQYEEDGGYRPLNHVLTEIDMHNYVRCTASEKLAEILIEQGLVVDYGKGGQEHLMRRARLITLGLLGELHLHEDETVDELADAVCAALRYRRRRAKSEQKAEAE